MWARVASTDSGVWPKIESCSAPMKSAGCMIGSPANGANSSLVRSMHRYQFKPPKNVPWCANESTNTSRSSSDSQSSGPGGSARMSKTRCAVGSKKRYSSRGMSPESVYRKHRSVAAKVDVELGLGDARLLEVEDVEEAVAEPGAHGVGRLHRRGWARRDPAPVHAERGDRVETVGPEQRGVPRHRRAPIVADDRGALDAERVEQPDQVADQVELGVLPDLGGHVGLPVAALVGRDRVEAGLPQGDELVAPRVPALGKAVAQDDRTAVVGSRLGDVHGDAVGRDAPVPDVVHEPSCWPVR